MSFTFDDSEFQEGLKAYEKLALSALLAGMVVSTDSLLRDSTDIVPFDKGFSGGLASTATKTNPKFDGATAESTYGYNKSYAARLHEDLSLNISQRRSSPGQTRSQKYLEKPMKENAKKYGKLIAKTIKITTS